MSDPEPMAGGAGSEAAAIADWVLREGRRLASLDEVLAAFCPRLAAIGIPIDRVGFTMGTLHPQIRARRVVWQRGAAATSETLYGHGARSEERYQQSPFAVVHSTGEPLRRRLDRPEVELDFPVLAELKAEGFTDYLVTPLAFGTGNVHSMTWASRQPGGFRDSDLAAISALLPALGALTEIHETRHVTRSLLATYLGHQAGARVLNGSITRGSAETIAAALWYCDLRGFTAMADRLPRDELIRLLNDYFACMVGPVHGHGGEVLKFIGDAMLAIFPIADDLDRDRACLNALAAAEEALADLARLNAERRAAGKPELEVGLALHTGAVMYGNIGAPDRLDFTVIGPAVNLVVRLEGLCSILGRPLIGSARFASPCGSRLQSLGHHRLKGIAEPQEVFGLP